MTAGFAGLYTMVGLEGVGCAPATDEELGSLLPDPNGLVDLQEGFSYAVISRAGEPMDDGFIVPGYPDGMAAFPGPDGLTILVRNHEVSTGAAAALGAFGARYELLERLSPEMLYDAGHGGAPCLGGTTTVVYDTRTRAVQRQFLSLAGTLRNCAGGPTPWNTWITCEETTERAGGSLAQDHGYPFEVQASAEPGLSRPVPLRAMGRFNHEAVAVDPASGIVYQTEDAGDGLLYRYIPHEAGNLAAGGRLQALAAAATPSLDSRNWEQTSVEVGAPQPVRWIDMEDIEAPENDLRQRGFARGAARFARGEGMWYGQGAVFFACTSGGKNKKGQIWHYLPSPFEGTGREAEAPGQLTLFVEPSDGTLVENADNLTVAPWGDLILCEDGPGRQFLVGVRPNGELYRFGRNALSDSEFAGVTFSPDGSTLFVNIQRDGLTLAITGPWQEG